MKFTWNVKVKHVLNDRLYDKVDIPTVGKYVGKKSIS